MEWRFHYEAWMFIIKWSFVLVAMGLAIAIWRHFFEKRQDREDRRN